MVFFLSVKRHRETNEWTQHDPPDLAVKVP